MSQTDRPEKGPTETEPAQPAGQQGSEAQPGGSQPGGRQPEASQPGASQPVVIKKYANRRLYNTESSSYITLDNLAEMIRAGRDFVVYDAKTGEDITRSVLTQIIVEEESKGRAMLPTNFLRQLIGFYGDSLQNVVPRYLDQAMASFARQQQQMRSAMGSFFPFPVEEMSRQNMAMMERAMSLFTPFYRGQGSVPGAGEPGAAVGAAAGTATGAAPPGAQGGADEPAEALRQEIAALHAEVDLLRAELAASRAAGAAPKKGRTDR